ncbi:hypothetical protein VNO77_01715 [Canavalia gladiata]|uniref:Uncharacterized protein n=1 Tax=Canavalia gladiata TaxID=3824 RepID=A0AAN9R2D5_CANGL
MLTGLIGAYTVIVLVYHSAASLVHDTVVNLDDTVNDSDGDDDNAADGDEHRGGVGGSSFQVPSSSHVTSSTKRSVRTWLGKDTLVRIRKTGLNVFKTGSSRTLEVLRHMQRYEVVQKAYLTFLRHLGMICSRWVESCRRVSVHLPVYIVEQPIQGRLELGRAINGLVLAFVFNKIQFSCKDGWY